MTAQATQHTLQAQQRLELEQTLNQATENCCTLVILANTQTPYRLHFHRRIVNEMPEVQLWSLFTHEYDKQRWKWVEDESIRTRCFGWGESIEAPATLRQRWRDWRKGGRIVRWMMRHEPDAILVLGYADIGKVRALRWAKRRKIATLMFIDSNVFGDRARGWRRIVKRIALGRILSWCDCLLPCGSAGEAYLRRYGVPDERIIRCPYEPDYRMILSLPASRIASAQERFGLRPGRRRIVYCGRLSSEKRVDLLLNAFARIRSDRPEWDLVLIGDGPLREHLETAGGCFDGERVIWTGFVADPRDVAAIYRNCDALALPSDYEPWGLVVNEAVAAGLAVIASDVVGAARELVSPGVNGALFEPGNEHALVDSLLRVTDADAIDALKAGSLGVLSDWRTKADPVQGLLGALQRTGRMV